MHVQRTGRDRAGKFSARDAVCCVVPSLVAIRHAPWSTSKAKCALRCSQEFFFRYVDKIPEPQVGPELRLGKAVHAALEGMLSSVPLVEALAAGRNELLTDEERAR